MKARDVVAGWPRGRSTQSLGVWEPPLFYSTQWYRDDRILADYEVTANCAYHASQQRMVDEYRCGCSTIGYLARETQSGILVVIPNELIGIAYAVEPNSSAGVFVNLSRGVVR